MRFRLNPLAPNGIEVVEETQIMMQGSSGGLTQEQADARYVEVEGDTMEGDLVFPVTGYIMTDEDDVQWRVTIDTTGHLVTTEVTGVGGADIFGLLLTRNLA